MKKVIISLLLFILFFQSSFGQKDLTGIYLNEHGTKIEIRGNDFVYIEPHIDNPVWYNDTLLRCSFKWVDNQFIELNSTPPYIMVQKGLKVTQSSDPMVKDSIKVSFTIPYQRNNLDVCIFTNNFKTFNLNYSKNNRVLMLPSNTKEIIFSISPGIFLTPHSPDGLYYGILYYSSAEYNVEKKVNRIDIEIPAIDDSFFEKYYLKGVYARIVNKNIIWKGEVYKKII